MRLFSNRRQFIKVHDLACHSRIHYVSNRLRLANEFLKSSRESAPLARTLEHVFWKHFDRRQMFGSYSVFSTRLVEGNR